MSNQKIYLEHVGWVTDNPKLFEKFWVDILGFKKNWESELSIELTKELFNIPYGATCRRYALGNMTIETHTFHKSKNIKKNMSFERHGLNHICLHVEDKDKFLAIYPFDVKIYNNPKGHRNIFLKDFEGNFIEIRNSN